jgi:hypothetical protein
LEREDSCSKADSNNNMHFGDAKWYLPFKNSIYLGCFKSISPTTICISTGLGSQSKAAWCSHLSNSSIQSGTSSPPYRRSLSFIASLPPPVPTLAASRSKLVAAAPLHPCSPTLRTPCVSPRRAAAPAASSSDMLPRHAVTCSSSFCWCLHISPVVAPECCIDVVPPSRLKVAVVLLLGPPAACTVPADRRRPSEKLMPTPACVQPPWSIGSSKKYIQGERVFIFCPPLSSEAKSPFTLHRWRQNREAQYPWRCFFLHLAGAIGDS